MKAKEIRELSEAEIQKRITELRNDLVGLRVRKQIGAVEKSSELKSIRRDIARLETVLTEKKKAAAAA